MPPTKKRFLEKKKSLFCCCQAIRSQTFCFQKKKNKKVFHFYPSRGKIEITKQIFDWLSKQIQEFNNNLDNFQRDVVNQYQRELDSASQNAQFDRNEVMTIWEPLLKESESIAKIFNQLDYQEISKNI